MVVVFLHNTNGFFEISRHRKAHPGCFSPTGEISYSWEASTVLYSAAPSRSETCLQAVREWDTLPRAGQRPARHQSIASYSWEASTVLYSPAPSRSETCLQAVREWDTLPRAGQRLARHQSIASYSWEASTVLYSAAPLTTGSTARRSPVVFLSPEKHHALTLRDLAPSSYGVGHSATRGPTPPHGTMHKSRRSQED